MEKSMESETGLCPPPPPKGSIQCRGMEKKMEAAILVRV